MSDFHENINLLFYYNQKIDTKHQTEIPSETNNYLNVLVTKI